MILYYPSLVVCTRIRVIWVSMWICFTMEQSTPVHQYLVCQSPPTLFTRFMKALFVFLHCYPYILWYQLPGPLVSPAEHTYLYTSTSTPISGTMRLGSPSKPATLSKTSKAYPVSRFSPTSHCSKALRSVIICQISFNLAIIPHALLRMTSCGFVRRWWSTGIDASLTSLPQPRCCAF